ncbi:L-asparaginase [Iodidimonas gelatinilytica]|uniref:L-asparaginase n=1 Tax=Iodidimonas gelatinilytica TaxID=1236966 RepID=A0A5A7MXX0_9PROT|nr:asparaginase [Iodidimonas gelatinilytica]GER00275.1 L-asparaginase [Iodidimonas gelatinilytica]
MTKPRIALFTLGGTIAMTVGTNGGVVPALSGDDLIAAVPNLDGIAAITVCELARLGSANIGYGHIRTLVKKIREAVADGANGIVVTQGTDTLAESAFVLSLLLDVDVPVIVTGAMRHPSLPSSDGPGNLLAAVQAASTPELASCGVLLCMNDELHAAYAAEKSDTASTAAFRSRNMGPVARLVEGRVMMLARPGRMPHISLETDRPPRVPLISASFDDDGLLLDHLPADRAGVVIAAFGGGHLSEKMADRAAILAATCPVVLASQAGGGRILQSTYGYQGAEIDLIGRGLIPAGAFSPEKSQILLTLLISEKSTTPYIKRTFQDYPRF